MDFVGCSLKETEEMLKTLGISSIESLFSSVPKEILLKEDFQDDGLSEYEVMAKISALSDKNQFLGYSSYLGAGAYEHHVPQVVLAFLEKSEFLTSYTPYQPEISQGVLQALFEFQSAVVALTGLDVANSSLYDGASALAEAALMALRIHPERKKLAYLAGIHPNYEKVLRFYLAGKCVTLDKVTFDEIKGGLDADYACLIAAFPNFLGIVEDLASIFNEAKKNGALGIVVSNPLASALFKCPAELGADIAVGDMQPFGIPLQFGGPYAGYIACKADHMRQLPGRIVGETIDADGKRGFVLTLQAREQHIRREKASSNICTNQTLLALASAFTIFWYGKSGIKKLALTCYQRAAYLRSRLSEIPGILISSDHEHFLEFAWKFEMGSQKDLKERFYKKKILPGVDLALWFPEMEGYFLTAVTETKSQGDLDAYVQVVREYANDL